MKSTDNECPRGGEQEDEYFQSLASLYAYAGVQRCAEYPTPREMLRVIDG